MREVNWVGLAGAVATFVLIAVSFFTPWWQFKIGDPPIVQADLSPLNTGFVGLGNSFTIPLIWALNIASLLSLSVGGAVLLVYSILPTKPYSKRLLHFAYNKPLFSLAFFVVSLIAMVFAVNGILGIEVPLMGSAAIKFPAALTMGAAISVRVSAEFLWPFWLAIATAVLCLVSRVYHRRLR